MITATLPYPPSVNHYWRHAVRHGRVTVYVSNEGRQYRRRVKAILAGVPKLEGRLSIAVRVHCPDARTRDLDNVLKGLLDSLTAAGVWHDDNQLDRLIVVRDAPAKGGLVDLVISQMDESS